MDSEEASGATPVTQPAESTAAPEKRISSSHAWTAGAIAAAVALALGEFLERLSTSLISLVGGVADLVVDITPGSIVAQSINTLGSMQKPLLLAGIVFVSIAIGGSLGVRARKNRNILPAGFLIFGLFGGFATGRSDLSSLALSWVAALFAAAVGAAVGLALLKAAERTVGERSVSTGLDRRSILYGGAAASAVALTAGSRIGRTSAAEIARDQILSDNAASASGGDPISFSQGAFDEIEGISQFITPIAPEDDFYLIDTATISRPAVNPDTWTLTIDGPYVPNPQSYTYQDLLDREHIRADVTLSCVSNPVGGDLVDNAMWTGIPLSELLAEAGVEDQNNSAHQVFSRSVDGWTCGFPLPLAFDGRTAMIALTMNGEPLPIDHGFPARLVVAGLYGYVSATKWVENIQVTDWDGVDGFWIPRNWSKEGPVKTQSRIDTPASGSEETSGATVVAGVAWNTGIGIQGVEVGFTNAADQTTTEWFQAELAEVESDETWVQWRYEWDAPPGNWFVQSRATDKSGFTQSPIPVAPAPNGAEGFHTIGVSIA